MCYLSRKRRTHEAKRRVEFQVILMKSTTGKNKQTENRHISWYLRNDDEHTVLVDVIKDAILAVVLRIRVAIHKIATIGLIKLISVERCNTIY